MKYLNSFREMKHFLILWSSQAISSLGSSMTGFALIIWVYEQQGTATSVALLSLFTYLPAILFCFIAGTLADRWDKKKVMLVCDLIAALGTVTVFTLYMTGRLQIWHLYLVNFLISFMNAFQAPASYVATSLLVPKEHYVRAGGLQAFSGSVVSIMTPALATAVLAFAGLRAVFIIDLITFGAAFTTLLFFIKLPPVPAASEEAKPGFWQSCTGGLRFLRDHKILLKIILFFAFINLLAYLTGFGIMPAMILARTGNDRTILGMVSTALGLGTLTGSLLVTLMKPPKSRTRTVFLACAVSFAICNPGWAIGRTVWVWTAAAFAGNLPLPFLNANLTTIMRTKVPIEMQGRVFAARDTVQYSTVPLGLFLAGFLADYVFEPFMQTGSPFQEAMAFLVGSGKGAGMALMFLITGILGCVTSLLSLRDKSYKVLD